MKITAINFETLTIYIQPQNSHCVAREITTIKFANLSISLNHTHYILGQLIFIENLVSHTYLFIGIVNHTIYITF